MHASVKLREFSELFELGNGLKQGCVIAPALSSIFPSMVLSDAFIDSTQRVWTQNRLKVKLFNVIQYNSARKTKNILERELMFTDYTAFAVHNHQDALEIITSFLKPAKTFRLKINFKKTEIIYQTPHPGFS